MAVLLICLISFMSQTAWAQDAAALTEEGAALLQTGDPSGALGLFDQAISADPAYLPARVNRGIALLSLGRAQDAILAFEVVLDRDPGNTPAWMYRGDALSSLGRTTDARESYARAAALEPDNPLVKERLNRVRASSPLQGITENPLILILGVGGIIVVCAVSLGIWNKKRKVKASPARGPDGSSAPGKTRPGRLKIGFPGNMRRKSTALKVGGIQQGGLVSGDASQPKNTLFDGIAASFRGKARESNNKSPSMERDRSYLSNPGPLQMAGGEFDPSCGYPGCEGDPENRQQIIEGYDRVLSGSEIDTQGLRGLSYYAMGMYKEALQEFEKECHEIRQYPGIYVLKASALLKLGRTEEALAICETSMKKEESTFEILKLYGETLESTRRWKEALDACDKALSLNPHSVDIWSLRARVLHGMKRDHEALQSCDRALGMDPSSSALILEKAVILAELGRTDDALSILDRAIGDETRETSLILEKGRILHRAGREREALKEYDNALAIMPGNAEAWKEMALVLRIVGDHREEAAAWERAASLSPTTAEYMISWGDALREAGESLSSAKVYARALRIARRDLTLWHKLGASLYSSGKYHDAAKAFAHITLESSGDGNAWSCLGYSLLKSGRPAEALEAFRKASLLMPENDRVSRGIGLAEEACRHAPLRVGKEIDDKGEDSSGVERRRNQARVHGDREDYPLPGDYSKNVPKIIFHSEGREEGLL
jgi:tetratricopeptide (TPR) repeat protein